MQSLSRQDAAAFVNALNALRPFVPPMLYDGFGSSPVLGMAIAVANGHVTCEVTPVAKPDEKPDAA